MVKPLWLKTRFTGMDVKLKEKNFPPAAAVCRLQFQPSAATMDHYCNASDNNTLPVPCTSADSRVHCTATVAEVVTAAEVRRM